MKHMRNKKKTCVHLNGLVQQNVHSCTTIFLAKYVLLVVWTGNILIYNIVAIQKYPVDLVP